MRERGVQALGEFLTLLVCYLVLCACGWAIDHLMLEEPAGED